MPIDSNFLLNARSTPLLGALHTVEAGGTSNNNIQPYTDFALLPGAARTLEVQAANTTRQQPQQSLPGMREVFGDVFPPTLPAVPAGGPRLALAAPRAAAPVAATPTTAGPAVHAATTRDAGRQRRAFHNAGICKDYMLAQFGVPNTVEGKPDLRQFVARVMLATRSSSRLLAHALVLLTRLQRLAPAVAAAEARLGGHELILGALLLADWPVTGAYDPVKWATQAGAPGTSRELGAYGETMQNLLGGDTELSRDLIIRIAGNPDNLDNEVTHEIVDGLLTYVRTMDSRFPQQATARDA